MRRMLDIVAPGRSFLRRAADHYVRNRAKKTRLKGGGTLTEYGADKMKKEAALQKNIPVRKEKITDSDIEASEALPVITMRRDAYFESVLRSGAYRFPDMYMVLNPFDEAPLTALILFETEKECGVRVAVGGAEDEGRYIYELPCFKYHRVPVLWLLPGSKNKVRIELLDRKGVSFDARTVYVKTKPLPNDLQDVIYTKKAGYKPAYERILITGGLDIKTCAFDRTGTIRHFLRRKVKGYGIFPVSKGRFIFMEKYKCNHSWTNAQCAVFHDMDHLGRVQSTYLTDNGIHHTVSERAGGNLLVGSNTVGTGHCEDALLEIDRNTGEVVWELKFEDLFGGAYKDMTDWAHINSSVYYKKDNTMICSLRNLHCVICVDYGTKELKWILSDPEIWEDTPVSGKVLRPVGEVPWFYQQHAAFWLDENPDGRPDERALVLFDNHWHKRRPAESFDGDMAYSYVSFYHIDESAMTVSAGKRFPCRKTKIRANGIYEKKKNRVYAMAGAFTKPTVNGYGGGIYEYDYDTGETISEFLVKPGFFRAYEFTPDFQELCRLIKREENYLKGCLKRPELMTGAECEGISFQNCRLLDNPELKYKRTEDCLFIQGRDHSVQKVYFHGKEHNYCLKLDETKQQYGQYFDQVKYYVSMQVDKMEPDDYKIFLEYEGEFGATSKYIKIGK